MAISRPRVRALMKKAEGIIRRAFSEAIRKARSRAQLKRVVAAMERGDIELIMVAAGIREGMWTPMTESIRSAYATSGAFALLVDLPKRFSIDFDINNPRAEAWLKANSAELITGNILPEQRTAIQNILTNGMVRGQNPLTTALDIVGRVGANGRRAGGVLGLTGQQSQFVINMMDDLDNLDRRYFTRRLRDKRFDKMVKQAFKSGRPLSQDVKNRIVSRYEDRLLKHRANNIARTESLRALNAANDEALKQIVDTGLAPANAITRVWKHSRQGDERPGHLKMNGQPRGIDEYFLNPDTGASLKHPGDGPASETVNCRCYVDHEIDFVAAERAA